MRLFSFIYDRDVLLKNMEHFLHLRLLNNTMKSKEAEEELKASSMTVVKDKITSELQENLKQKTEAILRGTYVESKEFDKGTSTIKVVVKSSTRDIDTAKNLSRLMGN